MGNELVPKPQPEKPAFESSIKRPQLRYFETFPNGNTVEFNYQNTRVYSHPEEFAEFDHVYRTRSGEGDQNLYYFKADYERLYDTIKSLGFIAIHQPFPTEGDEKLYYQFQSDKLQRELNKFSNGGDL